MSILDEPIEKHMTETVITASVDDDVSAADALLRMHEISSLPVMGRNGDLAGVLSFRDLLEAGHVLGRMMGSRTALTLPESCVGDVMTATPITVDVHQPLREAARILLEKRIHRVYVLRGGQLVGVVSANDLLRVAADLGITAPIARYATAPVITVDANATLFQAVELLASTHVSGVVVVEDKMPIGLFTQLEAVAQRALPAETLVSHVLELSVICLPWPTPLSRAAAFAAHSRARRVLAMDGTELRGILTALDFVRAALA